MVPLVSLSLSLSLPQYSNYKLIYRRYAGLFFTLCVDVNDNELLYFESIHLFVELLDQFFGNVCELDLVFNFNKVYMILDEFFLAGEVQETSKQGNRAAPHRSRHSKPARAARPLSRRGLTRMCLHTAPGSAQRSYTGCKSSTSWSDRASARER